jgi:hypothetical protein
LRSSATPEVASIRNLMTVKFQQRYVMSDRNWLYDASDT